MNFETLFPNTECGLAFRMKRKLGNPSLSVLGAIAEALEVDIPRLLQ